MGVLQNLINKIITPQQVTKHLHNPDDIGWHGLGSIISNKDDYENAFPSIRVIAQSFAVIEPYMIDRTGARIGHNILDRLFTPNTAMSAYDFRETLAVMMLVHDKVYIRVHHRTTRLTPETVTGFTFLEGVYEEVIEGKLRYRLANGEILTPETVMVLKGVNPYRLHDGYSPARASRRWTTVEDLIADLQAGTLANGAVPAGQLIISARTTTDFEDIRRSILKHHQGASKSNNVMFVHRPLDASGSPTAAQVEWTPFATNNKDLALKDIFEQVNKKIDSVYGVPASIRGVNDTNTYASVRVDQQIYVENTLRPFTHKIWQSFTHGLNRITGGFGGALTFDLPTPVVADEEKVRAEAQAVQANTIISLSQTFELESIASYMKSSDIADLVEKPEPVEPPEVLDSEEARDTPEQPIDPTELPRTSQKAIIPTEAQSHEADLQAVVLERLRSQVAAALPLAKSKSVTEEQPVDEQENSVLAEAMAAILLKVIGITGSASRTEQLAILQEAGIPIEDIAEFALTDAQRSAYMDYLTKVATDINETTAQKIRDVLLLGREQQLPLADLKKQLEGLVDASRAQMIARSEIHRSANDANRYSMENITEQTGITVRKVWSTNGSDPCTYCQALNGTTVGLDEPFVKVGDAITGRDGSTLINNFVDMHSANAHPNCECSLKWERVQ